MQDEVNQKTIALSIRATKLTGRVLASALRKILEEGKKRHQKALTPQGRQSVKKLMNDYAFHKVSPGHYLLFFKTGQADAMTAAFQKYSDKVLNKGKDRASILGQLRNLSEHIKSRPKERQKTREAVKEER